MTIQQFIEKMLEGGWLIPDNKYSSFHGEYPRNSALEIEISEYMDTTMIKFWHKKIDFGGGIYTSIPLSQILLDPEGVGEIFVKIVSDAHYTGY